MTDLVTQIAALSTNQLLVAGVGTTIAAAVAIQARSLFSTLWTFAGAQTFSTLTARSNGASIVRLTQLLARHRLHASGASYSVSEDNELTIGFGSGLARWHGVWIWYDLSIDSKAKAWTSVEVLTMRFLSRDRTIIARFLAEALDVATLSRDTIDVHHRGGGAWCAVPRKKRPLETVFTNAGLKADLVDKLRWFLANEDWYVRRGLNYKLVILLHGVPGTGKSSLIQALASHFNRDLYCLDTLSALGPEIGRFANGILAIEDIDTLGTLKRGSAAEFDDRPQQPAGRSRGPSREEAPASPKAQLHAVLNTLDGLATPHGLITIVTTNDIAALDPAMVRPCRIDVMREVTALDFEAFRAMFASHFDGAQPDIAADAYAPQTGARLQEVIMGAAGPAQATASVCALCRPMSAAA